MASAHFLNGERADFKSLTSGQSRALTKLESIYIATADLARQSAQDQPDSGTGGQLLKTAFFPQNYFPESKSRVLGIEDSPVVKRLRLLGAYFTQGLETSREITSLSKTITQKNLFPGSKLLYPDTGSLLVKTFSLGQELTELFTYLDQNNKLAVKQAAVLTDLIAGFDLLLTSQTEVNLEQVQRDLENFSFEISALEQLGPFSKSSYLSDQHQQRKTQLTEAKKSLDDLLQAIVNKNTPRIITKIGDFNNQIASSGLDVAKEVEFWQGESTRQGITDMRGGWDKVAASL